MLKRLKIERFKQVESFDQTLKRITVLVGTNNSGKTSILHAIHSAVALAQSRLRLSDQKPMSEDAVSFTISSGEVLYLPLVETNWLAYGGKFTQNTGPLVHFFFDENEGIEGSVTIKRGKNRNLAVNLRGRTVIERIEKLSEPFSVYVPGLAGIAKNEAFISYGNLLRSVARGDANLVLRNVLYVLQQQNDQWVAFGNALREVFSDKSLKVRFSPSSDDVIGISVIHRMTEIPLDCVGTGFLQTVQILSYIFLFKPSVLLLDEPDSHLHPNNQRTLVNILWQLASDIDFRVIIATHSRHILDALREREDVGIIWMRNGISQSGCEHVELLADLGAFDKAEGLLTKGIRYVILTEDEDTSFLKHVLQANGFSLATCQIWSYKGCSKIDVAQAIASLVKWASPGTKVILHRDADYLSEGDQQYFRSKMQGVGIDAFFTPGVDIEGLFCRIEHLKECNPVEAGSIQEIMNEAHLASREALRSAASKAWEEVEMFRFKNGLATQGNDAKAPWLDGLDFTQERWIHGKKYLSSIRSKYQQAHGKNLTCMRATQHLRFNGLADLVEPLPAAQAEVDAGPE